MSGRPAWQLPSAHPSRPRIVGHRRRLCAPAAQLSHPARAGNRLERQRSGQATRLGKASTRVLPDSRRRTALAGLQPTRLRSTSHRRGHPAELARRRSRSLSSALAPARGSGRGRRPITAGRSRARSRRSRRIRRTGRSARASQRETRRAYRAGVLVFRMAHEEHSMPARPWSTGRRCRPCAQSPRGSPARAP